MERGKDQDIQSGRMRTKFTNRGHLARTGRLVLLTALIIAGFLWPPFASSEEEKEMVFLGFTMGEDDESKEVPEGWDHLSYLGKARNEVSIEKDGQKTVVRMKSLRSISALITRPEVSPKDYPILVWRWKVDRVVGMAIESQKDRNDCAARVRVIFGEEKPISIEKNPLIEKLLDNFGITIPARSEPPGFKIDYIWGNNLGKGDVIDHPGSKNHKMVALQQGKKKADRWIWEKRNVREDFETFFGREVPNYAGIAVMSDTDQTNEGVDACFSSIVLMKDSH